MGQVHHPPHFSHFYSHEWPEFRAKLVASFKRHGLHFGIAALLAVAALIMMKPLAEVNMPQKVAEISDATSNASWVAAPSRGYYLPGEFHEQQKNAKTEEFSPQF
ncbi:MAG: hypothetical protein Q7K20_16205 [Polaromonas sp.]|jgi:hypothetical protein|nr:hypothetical protein [Polaromonas sp.]